MPKKDTPSPVDLSQIKSNQPVMTINLIVLGFLVIILLMALAPDGFVSFSTRLFFILLALLSITGLVLSSWLILRKSKNQIIEKSTKEFGWRIGRPEVQKSKLSREVLEIAEILDVPADQYSDLILAYIVAEDLALRQIQQEADQPLIRHANIGETEFDGILIKGKTITCIEVTFLVAPEISPEKLEVIRQKTASAQKAVSRKFPDSNLKLLLVLVMQLDAMGEAQLRSSLTRDKFAALPVNLDIHFYSFEGLQKIYTMD